MAKIGVKFPLVPGGGGGGTTLNDVKIPQLDTDPINPAPESAWVLKSGGQLVRPRGLLLALTYSVGTPTTYELSFRTKENTTVRTPLT